MITALDHIQLALPAGAEDVMRVFYCEVLGCVEVTKPAELSGRGGFWVTVGALQLHFGVDPIFQPATKAHPAFRVSNLDQLALRLDHAGFDVRWDDALPQVRRIFTSDPVGNRIELIAD